MTQPSLETKVVSYGNLFPFTFQFAKNALLTDEEGRHFIDFFSGAGVMNFGHNHSKIKSKVLEYLNQDTIIHGLDMSTTARREYFDTIKREILDPRDLHYKIITPGPTGTNAVETALKVARKATGRETIFAFSGAFHGMTLGSLSLTSDRYSRNAAGVPLQNVVRLPYVTEFNSIEESINYIRRILTNEESGVEIPAAMILETVQAEGGVNIAPAEWLQGLRTICDEFGIKLIIDDIQVGIGRVGTFFSFEEAKIVPDMVTLSKSLSGLGIPLSLLLIKEELDVLNSGEHNGTFRGHQIAFVSSQAAIEVFNEEGFTEQVTEKEGMIKEILANKVQEIDERIQVRGKGMIWGIDFSKLSEGFAEAVQETCLDNGVLIEFATKKSVLKVLPPLTIEKERLENGLNKIVLAVQKELS